MIFPAWQQQVADVLRAAPGDGAQAAEAPASALDRMKQDGNPMAAVLDFGAALRQEPADRIAARLPALLRFTAYRLGGAPFGPVGNRQSLPGLRESSAGLMRREASTKATSS